MLALQEHRARQDLLLVPGIASHLGRSLTGRVRALVPTSGDLGAAVGWRAAMASIFSWTAAP
jgi:hypothetical protein